MSEFSDRVYDIVRRIPEGRVINYGGVAALLGTPRAARGVGYALGSLPEETDVPWWRVINRHGEISIRHDPILARIQRALLEDEGVEFDADDRVDWSRFRWVPDMPPESRPIRRAISFVIRPPDRPDRALIVRRPPDDEDLPDVWGLPAGSLREGESWEDAVRRSGREKLGVRLDVGRELNRGTTERAEYTLEMRLFDATIAEGEPRVPQPHPGVTQYTDWRWAEVDALEPAARQGSLCSRLCLEAESGHG